ncbi:MAG: hypothetical protein J5449_04335 [Oscillospiraceae bacterium]|nr:hypothetical protein [Oscillospiraceae bacterium]
MSRESEKIFDGITGVGEDLIEAAQEPVKKRRVWLKWCAAAAALMLVAGGLFVMLRGGSPDGNDALKPYRIATVAYPKTVQRPNMADYTRLDGQYDYEAYIRARQEWNESTQGKWKETSVYRGKLDGFLTTSIPMFLDGEVGENRAYSPLNVYLALAMLAEATGGESRAQLLSLLGVSDTAELQQYAAALWNVNYVDDGMSASILSSSLWLNKDIGFVQQTMDTLASDYRASSYRGEMGSAGFNEALRQWLNESTGGLLFNQVEGVELSSDTLLAILTAVYLRAPWVSEFDTARTETGTFHASSGDMTCDFLHGWADSSYYWGDRFSAVVKQLTLGTGQSEMWFILPDEGVTPEELTYDDELLRFLLTEKTKWQNSAHATVLLHVPKFDVSSETDLVGGLKALGMTNVFDPGTADFTPMLENADELLPYVSKAVHAARVSIDEEGIVAAAYTEIDVPSGGMPPKDEVDFTLDRPFLFVITGMDQLPLFVGIVNKP